MNNKFLILVVGPTAVGKTSTAIQLANDFNTQIISADARQVFKELSIGTAKPTDSELAKASHHFVSSHSIFDDFNAGIFASEANDLITKTFHVRDYIILCGGSGLYINALLYGFDDIPEVPPEIRQSIISDYSAKGLPWLQEKVLDVDPDYYQTADTMNPQRLMRALEVFTASGKPFSSYRGKRKKDLPFNIIKIGLNMDRSVLYKRIDDRMDGMIAAGLFKEAASFFEHRNLNALQTVGYQEIFGFMEGKYGKEEAIRLLKRNTRRYAKRQLTWFQNDKEIKWFHPDEYELIVRYIQEKSTNL